MHDNDHRLTDPPGKISAAAVSDEDLWMSDTQIWEDEMPLGLGVHPGHIPASERPAADGSSVVALGLDLGRLCSRCGKYCLDDPA